MKREEPETTCKFPLRAARLLCAAAGCLVIEGTPVAFSRPEAPAKPSDRTLTFEERVVYQRAIEDVYWRHRIWPKVRPDAKPSLDAVMSQAQLEKKVEGYLSNSQALDHYLQQPLTAEQLQGEMDRMAQHTKQPEVLRELFAALGNDPFVIAECLARPILTERLVADLSAQGKTGRFEFGRARELSSTLMAANLGNAAYTLPKISEGDSPCTDDTWTATSTTNAPSARDDHTAVWTGSEMIVWGGSDLTRTIFFNTGGRYNPSTDSWTATSTNNTPIGRYNHTSVWTGSEMIVWGGEGCNSGCFLNSGGRYSPGTDTWTATSTTNAPTARYIHTAIWTGSEMIVWGGQTCCYDDANTGGRYDPGTDSWTATSITNAPQAREGHTAVWIGEMIVWGGATVDFQYLNTGGRYNPSTDSWTATSTTNAPQAREGHTAVWIDNEMIVWGGYDNTTEFNTGEGYDPLMDSWTPTSITNAPLARDSHTAVSTDSEMVVWGGEDGNYNPLNTGGRYNPSMGGWTATSTTNAPDARWLHTAVWTGSEMVIWGGTNNIIDFNTGGRYSVQSGSPTPIPTATATPRATVTPTPTSTPTPIATPRVTPTPRSRPTPAPRS